jgi:SEC-C motif/Protein of unknown function (DUF1186)
MVERLLNLGTRTDDETISSLLRRKEESRPLLTKLVGDEDLWETDSGYSTWAPICAIHLLSVMGGRDAVGAVGKAIREHHDETGDWITEDAPSVLSAFGADAFEVLAEMVLDRDLEEFCRSAASRALLMMSGNNEELRQRSISLLRDAISAEKDDMLARSILTDDLCEFKDPDSLEFIRSLFQMNLIDKFHLTYEEVLNVYAGKYDEMGYNVPSNPLDIFSKSSSNFYRRTDKSPWLDRRKVGRNENCPCGSGKKFKKCCMTLLNG